jgi:hypothetical protein
MKPRVVIITPIGMKQGEFLELHAVRELRTDVIDQV